MTLRVSTGLRNHMAQGGSYARAFQNGCLIIYSGTQPASADAAATGTQLCKVTAASGAHTPEVRPAGSLTLNSGASGSINTLTVDDVPIIDGAVAFNGTLSQTATDLATAINNCLSQPDYTAEAAGAVVTITGPRGMGANGNTFVVAATYTTITGTPAALSGGVNAINGLRFGKAAAGVIAKLAAQVWSGVNDVSGTAGWYRFYASLADAGAIDAAEMYLREDGQISISGAQLNMSATTLTGAATTTIDSWSRTFPAA